MCGVTTPSGCSAWASFEDLSAEVAGLHAPATWCSYFALATDVLWAGTGRRWRGSGATAEAVIGESPPPLGQPTEQGVTSPCTCSFTDLTRSPWSWRGAHREPVRVRLPHPDVTAVSSVTVDGASFGAWRLEGSWLTRTDGRGWSICGGTTTAAYAYGIDPPLAGKLAVVEYASELGKAAAPDCDMECRLPQRVRSVTRQGISFEVIDPLEFLEKGFTGLPGPDAWITATNPRRRPQAGRVWSPDINRSRRIS